MTYVSIGIDCGPSLMLKNLGLRTFSLPFDWVVTYKGVAKIIRNDFVDFLPPISQNKDDKFNLNSDTWFLHNTFPDDIEQINRRVDRFKNLLETSTEKITFIRKGHANHHHNEHNNYYDDSIMLGDVDDALNLHIVLKKKYPKLIFEIYVFLICEKCYLDKKRKDKIPDNIKIFNISTPYEEGMNKTTPQHFHDIFIKLFKK